MHRRVRHLFHDDAARALSSASQHDGQHATILGGGACTALEVVMTVNGATDVDVVRAYVQEVLGPTLREGDIIADNPSTHKSAGVQEAVAAAGARRL